MRIRTALRAAAWVLAASIFAAPAVTAPAAAQRPQQTAQGDRGAQDRAGGDQKGVKDPARELTKAFKELRERLRTTRQDRRAQQVKEVRDKWGALVAKPAVREELRLHARRITRLDYIESLSDDLDMDTIQKRAKRARDLENDRHDKRMEYLKARGGEQ